MLPGPVLLTGATGFLGGYLVEALLARGTSPICLARPSSDTASLEARGVQIRRASLEEPSAALTAALHDVRCVIHAAGAVRALDHAAFMRANARTTEILATACLAQSDPPERFVLVSSVGALGPPPPGDTLREDSPPGRRTDYGRSKWEGEQRALACRDRMRVLVVRPTAIYGPRDRELLPVFRAAARGWLPAFAGPEQVYNLAHAEDIADGVLRAAAVDAPSGSTWLLGCDEEVTARDLATLLGDAFGRPVRLLPLPRALLWSAALCSEGWAGLTRRAAMLNRQKLPELTGSWRLDLTRAREDLGCRSRFSPARGIAETLAWYRAQGLL